MRSTSGKSTDQEVLGKKSGLLLPKRVRRTPINSGIELSRYANWKNPLEQEWPFTCPSRVRSITREDMSPMKYMFAWLLGVPDLLS
jgi:hypothetical protein